jgi:hypothetical protein
MWLPLFLYTFFPGVDILDISTPEWLAFPVDDTQFKLGLGLSWLATGLVGVFVILPGTWREEDMKGEIRDVMKDGLAEEAMGAIGGIFFDIFSVKTLLTILRILVALASGYMAWLVAQSAAEAYASSAHNDLILAVGLTACVIVGLHAADILGLLISGVARVLFSLQGAAGAIAFFVGGITVAMIGGLVAIVFGIFIAVFGIIVNLLARDVINVLARATWLFVSMITSGILAGLLVSQLGFSGFGFLIGLVATLFGMNAGGGVAGVAITSVKKPKIGAPLWLVLFVGNVWAAWSIFI